MNGTSQEDRLHNLQKIKDYKIINDLKGISSEIIFSYLLSDVINFHIKEDDDEFLENTNNNPRNLPTHRDEWKSFIENDDIVGYSLILHTNMAWKGEYITKSLLSIVTNRDAQKNKNLYSQLCKEFLQQIQLLLHWYDNLSENNVIKLTIENDLSNNVSKNFVYLTKLLNILENINTNSKVEHTVQNDVFNDHIDDSLSMKFNNVLNKYVFLKDKEDDDENPQEVNTQDNVYNQQIYYSIRDLFEDMFIIFAKIQRMVEKDFYNNLYNGNHKPHITLLLTYCTLINKYFNNAYNKLPWKFFEYYYKDILLFKEQNEIKDKTIVYFINEYNETYFAPQGTQLSAGKDSVGNDIIFATISDLNINHGSVQYINTCEIITKNTKLYSNENNVIIKLASYDANNAYKQKKKLYINSKKYDKSLKIHDVANINNPGFIIQSSLFESEEGDRKITLTFYLDDKALNKLKENSKNLNINYNINRLTYLFAKSLQIKYSTKNEWVIIPKKQINVNYDNENKCINFELYIIDGMPSINKATLELPIFNIPLNYAYPAIYFENINENLLNYTYLFESISVNNISITIDVKNVRNLILQNDFGLLSADKDFFPFGTFPQIGSTFYVGHKNLFNKPLTQLKINIKWNQLPKEGGLQKLYKEYPGSIKASDFLVNISYLYNKLWNPRYDDEKQILNLFSSIVDKERKIEILSDTICFDNINLNKLLLNIHKQTYVLNNDFYNINTESGFLKFELISPINAFGHKIYPQLIANSYSFINKKKILKNLIFKNVQEPYTPIIQKITIDYTAEKKYLFPLLENNDIEFFNTLPFGYIKCSQKDNDITILHGNSPNNFLKFFDYKEELKFMNNHKKWEYVDIYINDFDGNFVSLFFHIDEASIDISKFYTPPKLGYVSNNEWIPFENLNIIYDSTNKFSKSGIIKIHFDLKKRDYQNNTIVDNKHRCLRLIFLDLNNHYPIILGIYNNAIEVQRISTNDSLSIPSFSIENINDESLKKLQVYQPIISYGGKPKGNMDNLMIRGHERISHSNRCIDKYSFENIVLEKFPIVNKVVCFSNLNPNNPNIDTPGNVTLVIVIKNENYTENSRIFPQASSILLQKIKEEIQKYCSPFIKVHVINPFYEILKFNIDVIFKENTQNLVSKYNDIKFIIQKHVAPWLLEYNNDIQIGNDISLNVITNSILQLPYVNYVKRCYVFKKNNNKIFYVNLNNKIIHPSYPYSVMYTLWNNNNISSSYNNNILDNNIGICNMEMQNELIVGPINYVEEKQNDENNILIRKELDTYYVKTKL